MVKNNTPDALWYIPVSDPESTDTLTVLDSNNHSECYLSRSEPSRSDVM